MNILLMLHISFATLCFILVPVLYVQTRRQTARHIITASITSSVGLVATGGMLLMQGSAMGLPLFCTQTSSLFFAMYAAYVLGKRSYRKQTQTTT